MTGEVKGAGLIVVPLPPEVVPYQEDIRRFVHAMVYKLKVHSKKGKWNDRSVADILPYLQGEVDELSEAIEGGNLIEILLETADVANYAMIAAAIATEKGK